MNVEFVLINIYLLDVATILFYEGNFYKMANNWYDSALTLKDRGNKQTQKSDKVRPSTKRTLYENLRSSKTRTTKPSRLQSTRELTLRIEEDDHGYDEDDEDEEDDIYSDYAYATLPVENVKTPRVQTSDGPEGCSCFPKRSNKRIPSMLYEGLVCKHSGLKGDTHAGVSKFDHNWREKYEEPDPSGVTIQKTNFVLGYPRPVNLDSDLQYYDEDYEQSLDTKQDDRKTNVTQQSKRDSSSKQRKKEKAKKQSFPHNLLDFMEEEDHEPTPPNSRPYLGEMPISLPRIGYSPPPPPSRERLSARSVARSLPPLPESPFLSSRQSKIKTSRSEKRGASEVGEESDENIDTDYVSTRQSKRSMRSYDGRQRRFKGHYFDPGKLTLFLAYILSVTI